MPDIGRIARVAVPIVAGLGVVAAVPFVLDVLHDKRASGHDKGQAGDGAAQLTRAVGGVPDVSSASPARRTYTNPVFAADAPDPSILRAEDGTFYAYATDSSGKPFQVLRSANLTSWTRVGPAFEGTGPSGMKDDLWAPDVKRTGNHYTMLYSGRGHDGRARIGYATSTTPAGPFKVRGVLIDSGHSPGYTIDPDLVEVEPGRFVLYYGSTGRHQQGDESGITAVGINLDADGTMHPQGVGEIVLPEQGDRYLVEAPWVKKHGNEWYIFYSDGAWDSRRASSEYKVQVAKGPSPTGPFTKHDGSVMQGSGGFSGAGHNSVVTDDAGQDWMIYHAWGPDHSRGRVLMMDPIEWKDGWPVVNGDRGASSTEQNAPVVNAKAGATATRG